MKKLLVFLLALIFSLGCSTEEQVIPEEELNIFRGVSIVETGDSNYPLTVAHENGSYFVTLSEVNNEPIPINVYVKYPGVDTGMVIQADENGFPLVAYLNDILVIFKHQGNGVFDVALINSAGQFEIVRDISVSLPAPVNGRVSTNGRVQLTSNQWAYTLNWAGHAISLTGCVIDVAAGVVSGGFYIPKAIYSCSGALAGVVADIIPSDYPIAKESLSSYSALIDQTLCASGIDPLACASAAIGGMSDKINKAIDHMAQFETEIGEANNQLNGIETGCDAYKITTGKYPETDNLNQKVKDEYGNEYAIADWDDLTAITDIDEWITCMGITHDQTFMLTKGGNFFYSGNRQYYVHYSTDGIPYSGFAVHDQIANKLFLGSWYGLSMNILGKK